MKSLNEFLNEDASLQNEIKDIWGEYLDKLSIYDSRDNIDLSMINIKPEFRRMGYASQIMKFMTDYADKNDKIIHLTPDSSMGTNKSTLKSFYMSHNFVFNKGVNKDFRFRNTMIRYPR